jgi:hypothetical protein
MFIEQITKGILASGLLFAAASSKRRLEFVPPGVGAGAYRATTTG